MVLHIGARIYQWLVEQGALLLHTIIDDYAHEWSYVEFEKIAVVSQTIHYNLNLFGNMSQNLQYILSYAGRTKDSVFYY